MTKLDRPTPRDLPRLVSVVIGTYNGARYLRPTIDSVLAQTYAQLEVIVVDDGSKDDTWAILQSYGDRIKAVRQGNGGIPVARNTGLSHARGEFIALMDHDDLCMPERIAIQVALMDQHTDVDLCCTEFSAFNSNGPIAERYSGHYYSQCAAASGGIARHYQRQVELDVAPFMPAAKAGSTTVTVHVGHVYDAMACGNLVHPPTVLFRASLLDKVGGFDPATRMICDWYWLMQAARAATFACIDLPLLDYRRSDTQVSGNTPSARIDTLRVAERIVAEDPGLWRRQRPALQAMLAEAALDVAYTYAEVEPLSSIGLLLKVAVIYGTVNALTLQTLAKALLPNVLLSAARRVRTTRGS
jgi:glycosyltransferase involved in cell wall biosynthesis